ncbi:MAG: cytochrome b/b6 domain-containing protein, partial [Microbacterium sp.]
MASPGSGALRRGLPRVAGGPPWPEGVDVAAAATPAGAGAVALTAVAVAEVPSRQRAGADGPDAQDAATEAAGAAPTVAAGAAPAGAL